jgi:hypothetical protein
VKKNLSSDTYLLFQQHKDTNVVTVKLLNHKGGKPYRSVDLYRREASKPFSVGQQRTALNFIARNMESFYVGKSKSED